MSRTAFKFIRFATALALAALFVAPTIFAQEDTLSITATPTAEDQGTECDADADGYVTLPVNAMLALDSASAYNPNGNYSPLEWQTFFNVYQAGIAANSLTGAEICKNMIFKQGAEPARCNTAILSASSGVYDTSKVSSLAGNTVNPGAFDAPNDGIDQNCDGADGKFVPASTGKTQNLEGLVQRSISLLSRAVVVISVIIMIYGGILYASAAGDEQKTAKARKTIVGAIIGLIVGLLAPTIIAYITASLA